jgi:hypothetical protein
MKFVHPLLVAASISLMVLAGNAFAEGSADDAFAKCRASASDEEIPGTEMTSYLRQCMASAGVSQEDIDVRTGQGGPASDEEAAPAAATTESTD